RVLRSAPASERPRESFERTSSVVSRRKSMSRLRPSIRRMWAVTTRPLPFVCRAGAMRSDSQRVTLRAAARFLAGAILVLLLAGCGTLRRDPVPLDARDDPSIAGFNNIRYYPLSNSEPMRQAIRQAFLTETSDSYETLADGSRRYDYLAVSG